MHHHLPAAVAIAFDIANVIPVFIHGLNRDVWLSTSVTIDGRHMLLIDASVGVDRLPGIADWVLAASADRLRQVSTPGR